MEEFLIPLTGQVAKAMPGIAAGIGVFFGFWICSVILKKFMARAIKRAPSNKKDVLSLLAKACRIALLVVGGIAGFGTLGIDVSALVAGLGLTGFALGFALRDALSNLLAGIMILIYQPFTRNDTIEVSGLKGEVIEIDLRYTSLESDGERILIPNSTLFKNPIKVSKKG
jgi:small-conductance mechanosensitive channel